MAAQLSDSEKTFLYSYGSTWYLGRYSIWYYDTVFAQPVNTA